MPTSASGAIKPQWLQMSQLEALARMTGMAVPTVDSEAWKYTSLKDFNIESFKPISAERNVDQAGYAPPKEVATIAADADFTLYFYNGVFLPAVSKLGSSGQPDEVLSVLPFSKVWGESNRISELAKFFLERPAHPSLGVIGDHHLAHFSEGAFVYLKAKTETKIAVVHLYGNVKGESVQSPFVVCPRQVFYFGEETKAEVIELHIAANSISFFVNAATDLILDRAAQVSFGLGQWLGEEAVVVHDTHLRLSRNTQLEYCNFAVASAPNRNEITCDLLEAGAEVKLLSCYAATDRQHIDNSSAIYHCQGDTKSIQVVKGVVSGRARAVFSGQLRIEQDAQRSDASQLNQNLLLSSKAEVDSRPQLEVFADDVKAAHGASVGELQQDEIFYLQSRGISREEAKLMLGRGYIFDVTGRLHSNYVKTALNSLIDRLPAYYFSEGE